MPKTFAGSVPALWILLSLWLVACKKDDPAWLSPPPIPDQSFTEEFDTVASAFRKGWVPINNSNPKGPGLWAQGGGLQTIFEPFSSKGSYAGFIGADYQSTSGTDDVISNWLISPPVIMQNGDKIIFHTRTQLLPNAFLAGDSTDYGNNLEVCFNRKNDGLDVGVAYDPKSSLFNPQTDRGDFELLMSINPPIYEPSIGYWLYRWAHSNASLFDPLAYPSQWTRFEVTINGLKEPTKGRFAFRYYTLDAGSNGNGTAVGIDQVIYSSKK